MKDFYIIQYVDAYYLYLGTLIPTRLKPHEACGYVINKGIQTVVVIVKLKGEILHVHTKKDILEGIVIPTSATAPYDSKKHSKLEKVITQIPIQSSVTVHWLDVVHVAGLPRYTCAEMYTEGILERVENDHVVLRDPETIRTYPGPIKNHPVEKPTFYIIPKSFITTIASI